MPLTKIDKAQKTKLTLKIVSLFFNVAIEDKLR